MKINLPVTGKENDYSDQRTIVSITDLKGTTTHANQDFLDVSGFSKEDLLGKNHNVVRHPDMPPAAFADLWQVLKKGESWIGIVNNRCKNGDNYWVDAFIGPLKEDGKIIGYQSVRHKPDRAEVERADALYKKINSGKLGRWAFSSIGYGNKIFLGMLAAMGTGLGLMSLLNPISWVAASVGLAGGAAAAFIIARTLAKPLEQAAKASQAIIDNPIARKVYSGRTDEIGQLQLALKMQQSRLQTLLGLVDDAAQDLVECAENTAITVEMSNTGLAEQRSGTEQVATALQEMGATIREVARNINETAQAAHNANEESNAIKVIVSNALGSISNLENQMSLATKVVQRLEQDSDTIGSVLDVIRGIAEQTNLLALNAAIEAARAGEQGRGFAVVADEVRTLAGRTADSTQEIQSMIETLQSGSREAVKAMHDAAKCSEESEEHVGETAESLAVIATSITTINDMSTQISTAVEEQIAVVEDIERNATNITMAMEQAIEGGHATATESGKLTDQAENLQSIARRCE